VVVNYDCIECGGKPVAPPCLDQIDYPGIDHFYTEEERTRAMVDLANYKSDMARLTVAHWVEYFGDKIEDLKKEIQKNLAISRRQGTNNNINNTNGGVPLWNKHITKK